VDESLLDPVVRGVIDELGAEADELRASRARVVAAAHAERRGIERELHDGVQQHLVALAVSLQLTRQLVDSDSAAAKALLDEMSKDVHDALDGVRELAWRIYPSLLLDQGLVEALRAAAAGAAIPTRVEVIAVDRHPVEIEECAYFSCLDALRLASHLVGADPRATLRLRQERDALLFEVMVDGLLSEAGTIAELTGVSDRLGAVGGRLTVSPEPGSLRISGEIPLGPAATVSSAPPR
jgi:signal transduction histidine kinase